MAKRIKTLFMASYKGQFKVPYFVGVDDYTQYSPDRYAEMANSADFEVMESVVSMQVHAEKLNESVKKGRVTVKLTDVLSEAEIARQKERIDKQRRTPIREDSNQTLLAYQAQLNQRGKWDGTTSGLDATFTRALDSVRIVVYGNSLMWYCDCGKGAFQTGTDPQTMCSHLDSVHPSAGNQESARIQKAYQSMGLSIEESKVAAGIEDVVLLECWAKLVGSEEGAKLAMKPKGNTE
jgi:hypothetical protein